MLLTTLLALAGAASIIGRLCINIASFQQVAHAANIAIGVLLAAAGLALAIEVLS